MPIQQGIQGRDSRFLRHDGSVPLTAAWAVGGQNIHDVNVLRVTGGGSACLGDQANYLRLVHNANEIIELLGVSNNQANLHLKNLRIGDLAGVGNRNVIADVNGDLSAP